jgi:hypothetical protein
MWIPLLLSIQALFPSEEKIALCGKKIQDNEGSSSYLVYWNPHEPFLSLGLGHFIWFPQDQNFPFEEAFPALLAHLKSKGCTLPSWISPEFTCPWKTREEFEKDSQKQQDLKHFLDSTQGLQAQYIISHSFEIFEKIINSCEEPQKNLIKERLTTLLQDSRGLFALVDYTHFKGSGLYEKEFKQGKGFGLKQVLLLMPDASPTLDTFIKTAQDILKERVLLSEGKEDKWLNGWLARIDKYLLL